MRVKTGDFNTFCIQGAFRGFTTRKIPKRFKGRDGHDLVYEFILETADEMTVPLSIIRSGNSGLEKMAEGEWVVCGGKIIHRNGRMCFEVEKIAAPSYTGGI